MLFRDPDELTQLIQHHIGIAVCIGILGDEEAEHPDEGAVQQLGRFAECFQLLQLLGKASSSSTSTLPMAVPRLETPTPAARSFGRRTVRTSSGV